MYQAAHFLSELLIMCNRDVDSRIMWSGYLSIAKQLTDDKPNKLIISI